MVSLPPGYVICDCPFLPYEHAVKLRTRRPHYQIYGNPANLNHDTISDGGRTIINEAMNLGEESIVDDSMFDNAGTI